MVLHKYSKIKRSGFRIPLGRDFPSVHTDPGDHPASCTMGTGRGVTLTPQTLLVPRSWKSRAIPLPTLWATTGPVTGTLYITFYSKFKITVQHGLNLVVELSDPRFKNDDWQILPKIRHNHHVGVYQMFPLAFPNLYFQVMSCLKSKSDGLKHSKLDARK